VSFTLGEVLTSKSGLDGRFDLPAEGVSSLDESGQSALDCAWLVNGGLRFADRNLDSGWKWN
jgi:hypothetical protein